MKHNWQILKVEQINVGSDTRFKYNKCFCPYGKDRVVYTNGNHIQHNLLLHFNDFSKHVFQISIALLLVLYCIAIAGPTIISFANRPGLFILALKEQPSFPHSQM